LEHQPIQAFELYISKTSHSKVQITLNDIIGIFEALSSRKMKQFHLELYEVSKKNINRSKVKQLESAFTTFLKAQTNLNYFYIKLWINMVK
jgi:hypothetical protein